MHLGNVFTAVMSWLAVRARGGKWILRIEDLDSQRSRVEYARQLEDDLRWLGLDWDEGGLDNNGPHGPYSQSARHHLYQQALDSLHAMGLIYGCTCRRADIMATQAPHQSDGRIVYSGRCRPQHMPQVTDSSIGAQRIYTQNKTINFTDLVYGPQSVQLDEHCGDFVLRRADGAWAYQLAVVVDDALMGVTEVMRGADLLLSAAQQIYLFQLLDNQAPAYCHTPLLCNTSGQRLSKRDGSLAMDALRQRYTPGELLAYVGHLAGIEGLDKTASPAQLIEAFDYDAFLRHCRATDGVIVV